MKGMLTAGLLVLLTGSAAAVLGPDWVEDLVGDAGSTPDKAQNTTGAGPLTSISGALQGGVVGVGGDPEPDFEDMYLVQIADPEAFLASTIEMLGGFTEFDSRVFIFDSEGFGLLGNDNGAGGGGGAAAQQGGFDSACCLPEGGCSDGLSEMECLELGGEFQGLDITCGEVTCPPTGACCFAGVGAGFCSNIIESACVRFGGFYNGDGTTCDEGSCFGACCTDDASDDDMCEETNFSTCLFEFGGVFQGGGTTCLQANCTGLPTGACCIDGDICLPDVTIDLCIASMGVYLGDGSTCDGDACTPGACCAFDGSCVEDVLASECFSFGGEFQGPGTTCSEVTCPPTGACCFISFTTGTCAEFIESYCLAIGGFFNGDGTTCDKDSCFGACCSDDGFCNESSFTSCILDQEGTYQGDGVTCLEANCDDLPTGACCIFGGEVCLDDVTFDLCSFMMGTYIGDGTVCDEGTCVSGACCLPDGTCQDDVLAIDCASLAGQFQGPGSTCSEVTCPPTGACCFITFSTGTCSELTESYCNLIGGFYNGDGTTCESGSCFGACCFGEGDCVETSFGTCILQFDGVYQGDGVTCLQANCAGDPTGGCCIDGGETCIDDVTLAQCNSFEGEYLGDGIACDEFSCDPTGACCFEGPECEDGLTLVECVGSGGMYQGDDTFCESVTCPDGEGSTVGNETNDGTNVVIDEPGLYYVAITTSSREPISAGGPIFFFATPTEISGPDGPGGNLPIIGWQNVPFVESSMGPVVPGNYTIAVAGVAFSGPNVTFAFKHKVDCVQQFKRNGHGKVKSFIAGNPKNDFDVNDIDLDSILLSRADGVGTPVPPHDKGAGPKFKVKDKIGNFPDQGGCNCDPDKDKDGVDDLQIPFRTDEIVEGLELADLPEGTIVDLVISGNRLDGSPFTGTDCIVLVGHAAPFGNLQVGSNNPAAYVDIAEFDTFSDQGGYTDTGFDRFFPHGTLITVSAETWMDGRPLIGWTYNGLWLRRYAPMPPELDVPMKSVKVFVTGEMQVVEAVYGPPSTPGFGASN